MISKRTASVEKTGKSTSRINMQSVNAEKTCSFTRPVYPDKKIRYLQKTIGNQALQKLFKSGLIKAKLKIGEPNDIYEQEADRVAEQVMSMPEPNISRQEKEERVRTIPLVDQISPLVQRQPEEEEELQEQPEEDKEEPVQGKLPQRREEEEDELPIQGKSDTKENQPEVSPSVEGRINSLRGGGNPMPDNLRSYFEPLFGYDFGGVRLHTDSRATETARAVNAQAFTLGSNIVFGTGRYSPETEGGKRLIAHELTHVVQQNAGGKLRRDFSDEPGYTYRRSFRPDKGKEAGKHGEVQSALSPVIQRWEASEHTHIGEQVYSPGVMEGHFNNLFKVRMMQKIPLKYYPEGLTYAQASAMADFFHSFDEMYNAPRHDIKGILEGIGRERPVLIEGRKNKSVKEPFSEKGGETLAELDMYFTRVTGGRYLDVAKKNYSHFSHVEDKNQNNNIKEWQRLHIEAANSAKKAKAENDPEEASKAFMKNSYADHFLGDAFASGHLTGRAPEESEMRKKIEDMLGPVIIEVLDEKEIGWVVGILLFIPGPGHVLKIINIITGLSLSGMEDIKGLPFKIVHDLDNNYGRMVTNKKGDEWDAFGDKGLMTKENKANYAKVIEAVTKSKDEIYEAAAKAKDPANEPLDLYPSSFKGRRWDEKDARKELKELIKSKFGMLEILCKEDDFVREYVSKCSVKELESIPVEGKAGMIRVLLDGPTGTDDETAILKILAAANSGGDVSRVVDHKDVSLENLLSDIDCAEYDRLMRVLKVRYLPSLPLERKQALVLKAAKGYTAGWEEKLINAVLETSSGHEYTEIVNIVENEVSSESDDIIVESFKDKKGELSISRVPGNLTVRQTVTLCKALISGACVGDDEKAVLLILKKQREEVFRGAVAKLTVNYIDSGIDGEPWDEFVALCGKRYRAGDNLGATIILDEKNDDAARKLVNGLSEKQMSERLSPSEWIQVIIALLSGSCGDADEDAIVKIVKHMAAIGEAKMVNERIGKSRMDDGVDGKQWDQVEDIMKGAGFDWS